MEWSSGVLLARKSLLYTTIVEGRIGAILKIMCAPRTHMHVHMHFVSEGGAKARLLRPRREPFVRVRRSAGRALVIHNSRMSAQRNHRNTIIYYHGSTEPCAARDARPRVLRKARDVALQATAP